MHDRTLSNSRTLSAPTVLVLAAGAGQRFWAAGGACHKLQAQVTVRARKQAVLAHVLEAVQGSGLPFHVVRPEHTAQHELQGMGTSIACGVTATAHAPAWLILPADLPWIQATSLQAAAQALQAGAQAVRAVVRGQKGHPVGFAQAHRTALQALRGDAGAQSVLNGLTVQWLELQDEGCLRDVDTPQDLQDQTPPDQAPYPYPILRR